MDHDLFVMLIKLLPRTCWIWALEEGFYGEGGMRMKNGGGDNKTCTLHTPLVVRS